MNPIISANNVSKHYGSLAALNQINLNIHKGEIVGLIGPNGAGKTTLLKAILGLTSCHGDLKVLGYNPRHDRNKVMQKLCFIADVAILPRWMKVSDLISFVAGVHPNFSSHQALAFLEKTDITLQHKIRNLSKGMVVQLHLAIVMAIDADLLILDEPTLGLDIIHRKNFYKTLLNDYFTENRTILVTTHQVEEIESILTEVVMIDHGKIIESSSMENIANTYTQVIASSDQYDALEKLKPISIQKQLGKFVFIFKNVDRGELSHYGEVSTPNLSDIFVASITGEQQ